MAKCPACSHSIDIRSSRCSRCNALFTDPHGWRPTPEDDSEALVWSNHPSPNSAVEAAFKTFLALALGLPALLGMLMLVPGLGMMIGLAWVALSNAGYDPFTVIALASLGMAAAGAIMVYVASR